MRATATLSIATHEECAQHTPFHGHPERPERLRAALSGAEGLAARRVAVRLDEPAVLAAIERVHDGALAARLEEACLSAPAVFDSDDNPISEGTYRSALAAVAAALAGVEEIGARGAERVWVPVRPPGHHALRDRAMGFCFFNNAAIAAEELTARGIGPVAIVDFDVHHGNATQAHFWERSDVFYLSVHRYPAFPGTGAGDEVGSGRGRGFTRNYPLAAGADDATYTGALASGLEDVLAAVTPAVWVVSAGFDAHREDPLGGMAVTDAGFGAIGELLSQGAGKSPLLAVLEGGYALEALTRSVRTFLIGLNGAVPS
ncbi:MAG TPA: histone deacetylase [Thermoanaerobaculaceae bacterium]|nr:histone deacetylase [Thermoanaerobaculaceae bacterium]